MSIRKRLVAGFGATALSPFLTAAVQLGTVPLLLRSWGATRYGDWVVLTAIPTYFALVDLGFGNASGSDMTYRVAQGDREGALRTFQSSWILLTVVSCAALILVSSTVWFVPWRRWFHLATISNSEAAMLLLICATFALLTQQTSVLESGFRCDGNFAAGTFWYAIQKFAEAFIVTAIAVMGGSLVAAAFGYLISRLVGTFAYGVLLFHRTPWLRIGVKHARISAIKALARPAGGFVALPLGYAVSLQGFVLVIGVLLGPVAAATFATIRTVTRLNFQVANTIGRAVWPELSCAFGSHDLFLARKLHRYACQASIALSAASLFFLWIAGPALYHYWIHDRLSLNLACFHVLLIVTVLSSFWSTSSVVPMSTNQHHHLATGFVLVSLVSLAFAWVLTPRFGITGAAVSLIVVDGTMCWFVLRAALRQSRDTIEGFLKGIFTSLPVLRKVEQV